ncbi:MAG: hypothetical protein AB2A00_27425 [Myxococcota bacterium]
MMRSFVVVTLLSTAGCLFVPPPPGNALGMEGKYVGEAESTTRRKYTSFTGGTSTTETTFTDEGDRITVFISRGYESDAVLEIFSACAVPLRAAGMRLELVDEAHCTSQSDSTYQFGNQTRTYRSENDLTITKAVVEPDGAPGNVKITVETESRSEGFTDEQKTSESTETMEWEFKGTRVSDE